MDDKKTSLSVAQQIMSLKKPEIKTMSTAQEYSERVSLNSIQGERRISQNFEEKKYDYNNLAQSRNLQPTRGDDDPRRRTCADI